MILSNEPGYYREGAFGIRLEKPCCSAQSASAKNGADPRDWLGFETLTLAPIDRRLIVTTDLSAGARDWLDAYHARVRMSVSPLVTSKTRAWLEMALRPTGRPERPEIDIAPTRAF